MKKLPLVLLLSFFSFSIFSQISVSSNITGKLKKVKPEVFIKFKQTTTIFILPGVFSTEKYNRILKEVWTVTPFKVIHYKDVNYDDFLNENFSFVEVSRLVISGKKYTNTFNYLDFKIYNYLKLREKIEKTPDNISSKRKRKRLKNIFKKHSTSIAKIILAPNLKYLIVKKEIEEEDIIEAFYSNDYFKNFKLGYLKNYFQKVNQLIKNNENYWLFGEDSNKEIKNLAIDTLYICKRTVFPEISLDQNTPEAKKLFEKLGYNAEKIEELKLKNQKSQSKRLDDLFKKYKYKYKYKLISEEELNNSILNNENLYYLSYLTLNSERLIQIFNSRTGEIIYREHFPAMLTSGKLKRKHITNISKKINKSLK